MTEVLLVPTKATDLPAALERTPRDLLAASTTLPLLNGIDLPLLRAWYLESRAVAARISVEVSRPRAGLTEQHSIAAS